MKCLALTALLATLSFSALAADLPQVQAPSELAAGEFAEGTVTRLSSTEVAEFLPWAQNARNQLQRALNQSRSLPLRERPEYVERAVRSVVARSGSRQYQALMRFSLNRGLLLIDELEKNIDMNAVGSQENSLDILQRAIAVGLSFYESDLSFQQRAQSGNATTVIPYAQFGATFMQNMYPGIVNVLDATAQYRLLYKLVEMVNWDLSRDAEAPRYAEAIVEAYEMAQDLPEQPSHDDKANLRMIRRLNSLRIITLRGTGSNIQNNNEADDSSISAPSTVGSVGTGEFSGYAYDSYSSTVRQVRARAANGTIVFTDGVTRTSDYVQELVRSSRGISVGEGAYDSYSSVVRTVRYITTGGYFIFTDGVNRSSDYVQRLVGSRGRISTGSLAYDSYSSSVRTVRYISVDGYFIFTDGVTRSSDYVQGMLDRSSAGIAPGDSVLDTYSNKVRTVRYVTEGGYVIFTDGVTRSDDYVSKLQ